jgi:hypothetical protein
MVCRAEVVPRYYQTAADIIKIKADRAPGTLPVVLRVPNIGIRGSAERITYENTGHRTRI